MTLILGPKDVAACTAMGAMVDAIEAGIREEAAGGAVYPPRMNLPTANGFFRVMPAVMRESGVMGFKVFNGSVEHGVRYIIGLYDAESGALLSLMDAAYLTAARTGATTGVATRYLAPTDAPRVGVIGSGLEGRTNLAAVCTVRAVERVKVFSPTPGNRERFAVEMADELGVTIDAVASPEDAVGDTDIVIVATNTTGHADLIAYRGEWMEAGQHVNSIGSTGGQLREIDPETFRRAHRIAMDSKAQVEDESGDAVAALAENAYPAARVVELKELVDGLTPARAADEITLFKSVGTAIQDVMAGYAVYQEALRQERGHEVDFLEHKRF